MNQEEANQKILELMNKKDHLLSEEEIELLKELMFQCDLNIQGQYGWTPLMHALFFNQSENLTLTVEQWDYLIKSSNLMQQDKDGWTPLMYAFIYNKEQDLNLNEEQINYLIFQSDLKQQDKYSWTSLIVALFYNKEQDLNLTRTQFQEMYEILDEKQKQTTFQKLIQKHIENNLQYQEEINILLYDIQFKPNKKTLIWLKENKYQDILQRIEKRNLFFQLNQDFKEIDNHQKYNKIKI